MTAVREEVNTLGARVAALTDSLHRDEVANAQAALRIEQLEQMVLEQFGMAPADLIAEYGPQVALPPTELEMAEFEQARERGEQVTAPAPMRFDRPTQERRPNAPSANWPSWAGSIRWRWRSLPRWRNATTSCPPSSKTSRRARKDLLGVVADVDARILQVFAEAFDDVEREFRGRLQLAVPRRRGPAATDRSGQHAHHRYRGRGASRPARRSPGCLCCPVARRR